MLRRSKSCTANFPRSPFIRRLLRSSPSQVIVAIVIIVSCTRRSFGWERLGYSWQKLRYSAYPGYYFLLNTKEQKTSICNTGGWMASGLDLKFAEVREFRAWGVLETWSRAFEPRTPPSPSTANLEPETLNPNKFNNVEQRTWGIVLRTVRVGVYIYTYAEVCVYMYIHVYIHISYVCVYMKQWDTIQNLQPEWLDPKPWTRLRERRVGFLIDTCGFK